MLDHQRLTDVFSEAVALPPARREMFLDSACVGEPELRREVLDLLRHDDSASAAFDIAEEQIAQPAEHDTIGPYELLELIGEGGMAVVYRAQQHKPVRRIVAVKLIKLGMDTRQFVARFESERQALAMMDHPNVARVYDAGSTNLGRPYFVMEYVPGQRILEWCDARKLTLRERLELFITVCEAVEHAHRKGIIHRDLKNSNILVTDVDGRALPKVIDFGVAKAVSERLTESTMFTERGQIIGTPEYMSPEQADRGALDVDTRSDVYSLGVLLYQLLAGVQPIPSELLRGGSYERVQQIIRETQPPRPSTRLGTLGSADATRIAQRRQTALPTLIRTLRSELEWIPLKAMRKDREQRYRSAAELADDIRNYLDRRPLLAGPESGWYRARKFLRRHKAAVVASAAMTLLLLGGIAATSWQAIRATRAEARALEDRDNAKATLSFLTRYVLAGATPQKIPDAKVREQIVDAMIVPAAKGVGEDLKDRPLIEASVREAIQEVLNEIGRSDLALPHAEKAWSIRRSIQGENHPQAIRSLCEYAHVLWHLGRFREAESLYKEALERSQRVLGPDHEDTLATLHSYAVVLQDLGRSADAEPLFKQTMERSRRLFGDDSHKTLAAQSNYARVLQSLGRLKEAERLSREALERCRRIFGNDHPNTLNSLNIYTTILESMGRSAEAEPLVKEAMERSRRVLGQDHPQSISALNSYANVLQSLHRAAEAEPLYKEALERCRRVLGESHPQTIRSLNNNGAVLLALQRAAEAEPLFKEACERSRRVLGENHVNTLTSLQNYAQVLLSLKRAAEAEPLAREALDRATRSSSLGPKHPRTKSFALTHANCLDALRRHDAAAAVRKQFGLPDAATRPATRSTQPASKPAS